MCVPAIDCRARRRNWILKVTESEGITRTANTLLYFGRRDIKNLSNNGSFKKILSIRVFQRSEVKVFPSVPERPERIPLVMQARHAGEKDTRCVEVYASSALQINWMRFFFFSC